MDLTFFNPHSQSESDFLASFVARHETLDYFLRQLRLIQPGAPPARHHMIVASRGLGKTSLLRRIAIAVRTEADLAARFIALTFREEQHNVISLDVFWRNCLQSLLEAREDEHASEAELQQLDRAWAQHAPRQALKRDDQDGDPACYEFLGCCERLGRRPLLLIDNIDSLLSGLTANHQWALRSVLQRDDGPVLISAAPRFPTSAHDPQAAFYDFFRIETLDKLNDQEVMRCLRTLATHRGERGTPVLDLLDKDPGRIAALNALAGGNPRTLNVLYGVLESHMSADVLSQLSALLDTFTSWYHSRTDELPMQGRAVFDALALNWDPMPAAEVGTITGLDTPTVSSQIARLEKAGLVESVSLTRRGKGRNGYQLSERFFNIWYLMRNGPRRARQSIRFLTVFLQSCYSITERRAMARTVLSDERADPSFTLGLAASLQSGPLRERLLVYVEGLSSDADDLEEYGAAIQKMRVGVSSGRRTTRPDRVKGPEDELKKLDRAIRRFEGISYPGGRTQLARALVNKGNTLGQLGRGEQGIEVYESVVARFGEASEPALREQVARALFSEGVTLAQLGRGEQGIEAYESVIARFGEAFEPALRKQVGMALVNKGFTLGQLGRAEQEIETYESVVARFDEAPEPALREQVAIALLNKGITLGQLGRAEQEIEVYESVVARFGEAFEPTLREQVAMALVNKGISLGQLGRAEQEIEVYESVVARFGEASEPTLREQVARALFNKGNALGRLGRGEQGIEAYESVVARFGEASEPALREQVAMALVNKGFTLGQVGRSEQGIEVYESVVAFFGEASEPALREQVAMALFNKGFTLGQLGRGEQGIEVYESVVARFGEASEPALREQVAMALFNKGVTLGRLGRAEEGIEVYESVVARFGEASEPALRKQVAMALVNKGFTLGQVGRAEQGIEVYESVVARFGEASEPALRERVAMALVNKGITLGQLGRGEQGIEAYESVVARFGEASEPALREQVAMALVNKGFTLGRLGRAEQEIEVYESVVARFGEASEPTLREQVARALFNKGNALGRLGRGEQEIEVYESVVARFGEASEPALREQVAMALVNKGVTLGRLGRAEQEIEVYESVVVRFGEAPEPALREQVLRALVNKGRGLGELGRTDEAEAALRQVTVLAKPERSGSAWTSLGNLLLDRTGNSAAALAAYESGLTVDQTPSGRAILHANCAYALALHANDLPRACDYAKEALADGESISAAGRHLLGALSCLQDSPTTRWPRTFEQIGRAVESQDAGLWSDYLDDLQRLLWFIIAQGEGETLRRWMDQAQYPLRYAPLYHAIVAAIDGEDHLLRINPETRQAAARIYEGIARRLKLYEGKNRLDARSASA
jgi:tetratricopeptide (TPR) repeat protein/DNA-binding transcriptional ArsR family regulator